MSIFFYVNLLLYPQNILTSEYALYEI